MQPGFRRDCSGASRSEYVIALAVLCVLLLVAWRVLAPNQFSELMRAPRRLFFGY